jgi:hypothetical protein
VLALCAAFSLVAAGEEVRLVPVFRAGGIYQLSNIAAHDLDGDGRPDIVACSSGAPMALTERSGAYVPLWHGANAGCSGGVAAGDLNGDGGAEIVTAYASKIMLFDPRGLSGPMATLTIPAAATITDLALGNVDDDPAPEIVATTGGATYVYDGATLEQQWVATGYGGSSVRIGDVDGDSRREIVVNGSTGYVLDGAAETQKWGYVGGFSTVWTLGNVDDDAKDEIVFNGGSNVTILNGDTFETSSWPAGSHALGVADADHDGTNEILVSYYEYITGRNPKNGHSLWTIINSYSGAYSLDAADLDGNGTPEVFWSNSVTIAVGNAGVLEPTWRSVAWSGPFQSAFGDLDGDGRLEYVIASREKSTSGRGGIEIFDGETHRSLGTLEVPSYEDYVDELAVGQLDNDPALEVAALVGYYGNTLMTWDGVTHQQEFVSNSGGNGFSAAMLIANIDADAVDEIILGTNDQHVVVLSGASNIIQKSLAISGTAVDFARADLNADTVGELVVATSAGITVYDMNAAWAVLGSQAVSNVRDVDATSADGGTVALATDYYYEAALRVYQGAALTPAYTCPLSAARVAFSDVAGEERLIVSDNTGQIRVYPLEGSSCPEVEAVFVTGAIGNLTVLDVTGDGRKDLIIEATGATTIALLGFSSELRGDVDGDEVITSDDIDDAVDYLFGAEPGISPSADATADERISAEDIFVLIDYEFAGGAAPQP